MNSEIKMVKVNVNAGFTKVIRGSFNGMRQLRKRYKYFKVRSLKDVWRLDVSQDMESVCHPDLIDELVEILRREI